MSPQSFHTVTDITSAKHVPFHTLAKRGRLSAVIFYLNACRNVGGCIQPYCCCYSCIHRLLTPLPQSLSGRHLLRMSIRCLHQCPGVLCLRRTSPAAGSSHVEVEGYELLHHPHAAASRCHRGHLHRTHVSAGHRLGTRRVPQHRHRLHHR